MPILQNNNTINYTNYIDVIQSNGSITINYDKIEEIFILNTCLLTKKANVKHFFYKQYGLFLENTKPLHFFFLFSSNLLKTKTISVDVFVNNISSKYINKIVFYSLSTNLLMINKLKVQLNYSISNIFFNI